MAKKIYTIEHLGCANCAAKMEASINKLPQVEQATLTFTTRQLAVTAPDPDAILPQIQAIISNIEEEAVIVTGHHHRDAHCACGHHHQHDHDEHCTCDHHHQEEHCICDHYKEHHDHHHDHHHHSDHEQGQLILGGVLFVLGLVLGKVVPAISFFAYMSAYLVLGLPILQTAGKNLIKGHVFDENFLMGVAT